MKIQPLISIIVPVYNLKEYLAKCVDSLLSQTYTNLEIILVNDGSGDGSGELCEDYGRKDDRVKVIHKANGGLVSAWKRGLAESRGRYISFVDGDDWVDREMIEDMLSHITGEGEEIVSCDYLIEKPGESRAVYQTLKPGAYDRGKLEAYVFPVLLGNEYRSVCLSRCMKLISRALLEKNAHYSDEGLRMGEDVAVILPSLLDCDRLVILDRRPYYHYYYNPASMVHKYDKTLLDNINELREIIRTVITEKHQEKLLGKADQEYIFLLMLVLKNESRGNRESYIRNIRAVCRDGGIRSIIKNTPVEVKEKANRLLYLVMRHPNGACIRLLRLAMIFYYRK